MNYQKNKLLLTFLTLVFPLVSFAQTFTLSGVVVNKDSIPLESVTVTNLTLPQSSSSKAIFSIKARVGDTLRVEAYSYKSRIVPVKDSSFKVIVLEKAEPKGEYCVSYITASDAHNVTYLSNFKNYYSFTYSYQFSPIVPHVWPLYERLIKEHFQPSIGVVWGQESYLSEYIRFTNFKSFRPIDIDLNFLSLGFRLFLLQPFMDAGANLYFSDFSVKPHFTFGVNLFDLFVFSYRDCYLKLYSQFYAQKSGVYLLFGFRLHKIKIREYGETITYYDE